MDFSPNRGDDPWSHHSARLKPVFSPHPGDNRGLGSVHRSGVVFPTPVGMNRIIILTVRRWYGFPHTRGDEPNHRRVVHITQRFPHTRGDERLAPGRGLPRAFYPHPWGRTATRDRKRHAITFSPHPGDDRGRLVKGRRDRFLHTRGDEPGCVLPYACFSFFPTPVGMNL
jgi:hypothetical protein